MFHQEIHLNRFYPLVGDPVLEINRPILLDGGEENQPILKAMLILPGGGYQFCSRREADPIAITFLEDSYCCFTLWYSTNTMYPIPQLEVMASVDYIKKHAKKLKINPDKIAVIGFSAGGHLAASYGMLENDQGLKEKLGLEKKDTSVAALVLSYPVITMGKDTHEGTMKTITGGKEELKDLLSVEKHVSKDYPPTFIWATKEDDIVPVSNTYNMVKALKDAYVKCESIIYPHLWHGLSLATRDINLSAYDEHVKDFKQVATWVKKAKKFLKKVLK